MRTLDSIRTRAYGSIVTVPRHGTRQSGAAEPQRGKGYRRSATGAEQKRRIAWGRKYGSINAAFWRQVHERERGT